MHPNIESIEIELHKCIHPEQNKHFKSLTDADAFVHKVLNRLDFNEDQVGFLMDLRNRTKGFDVMMFVQYLYDNRFAVSEVFPGFISRLDVVAWQKVAADNQLKNLLKGKRVALVGPSQHMVGSNSAKLIDSYDLVVRLNTQWPVPLNLREDLGSRMEVLFHCCNGDVSLDYLAKEELKQIKLICYELGLSSFKLKDIANQFCVRTLNVTPSFWQLAQELQTSPNTGTVATCMLLDSDLEELFITGLTYLQDPYYENYHAHGNVNDLWKNGNIPQKVGPHEIAPQFHFVKKLLNSDKRVKADWRLQQLLDND